MNGWWLFAVVLIVLAVLAVRQMGQEGVWPTRVQMRVWWRTVAGWDNHFGDIMPKRFRRSDDNNETEME